MLAPTEAPPDDTDPSLRIVASRFEARKASLRQNLDGTWLISLTVAFEEVPYWLMKTPAGTRLAVAVAEKADDETPIRRRHSAEKHHRAVATAGLLCRSSQFQTWLAARYDNFGILNAAIAAAPAQPHPEQYLESKTAEALRTFLGIPSRSTLKFDDDALAKFNHIVAEFTRETGVYP